MKKRDNERGLSLINLILICLIVIAVIIVAFLLLERNRIMSSNDIGNDYEESVVVRRTEKRNRVAGNNEIIVDLNDVNVNKAEENNTNSYAENKYYYNQLNGSAKSMYNSLEKNIGYLKNGYKSIDLDINTETAGDSFQSAWDAFELDHPDLFYVETTNLNLLTKTTTGIFGSVKYEYVIQPKDNASYFTRTFGSEQEVEQAITRVEAIANNIASEANTKNSRYEKVKYVHDYIVENAHYDQEDTADNSTIYGLLVNNAAICEGYAKGFKYLMDKLNIPCVIVYGEGIASDGSSEYHAWNEVQMEDGIWYAIDSSWDDPIIIGSGRLTDEYKYKYFLVGSENFSSSHIQQADVSGTGQNFKYPELSTVNY